MPYKRNCASFRLEMALLDFLLRRARPPSRGAAPVLHQLRQRIPSDGAPGLLPSSVPEVVAAEVRLGERFAAELHAWGAREPLGLGRRAAAIADAARRRRTGELAEALDGVAPWELPALLEALEERKDLDRNALLATARTLAGEATTLEQLAGALGLLALGPAPEDLPLLEEAARCPALTGVCAVAAEPLGGEALLSLARVSTGLGRALALERLGLALAEDPTALAPLAPEALRLAATVEDGPARAYAAVPLLELADAAKLLAADPGLAEPIAACLEATALGGWNGGPGPGLGRLPGAIRAAEALLGGDAPAEARARAAQAVLDAHPMPAGPVRTLAQQALA